jgi:hypothetical protein
MVESYIAPGNIFNTFYRSWPSRRSDGLSSRFATENEATFSMQASPLPRLWRAGLILDPGFKKDVPLFGLKCDVLTSAIPLSFYCIFGMTSSLHSRFGFLWHG